MYHGGPTSHRNGWVDNMLYIVYHIHGERENGGNHIYCKGHIKFFPKDGLRFTEVGLGTLSDAGVTREFTY